MKRSAFTLIELLVVIAIIAILAAILFPVFAQAKVAAKESVELSNTKQDNLGAIMYEADSDDIVPPLQVSPNGYNDVFAANPETLVTNYGQLIYPYTKNWLIGRNPLNPGSNDTTLFAGTTTELGHEFNATQRWDHGYNFFYLAPLMSNLQFTPVSSTSLSEPAQTIFTTDSVWTTDTAGSPQGGGNWFVQAPSYDNSATYYWFGPWTFTSSTDAFHYGFAWDYAKGRVVMSFADGHAKVEPTPQLWAGADPNTSTVIDWSKYLWGGQP